MYLVDTSCWIEQLRRGGKADVRHRVERLLEVGEAVWCPLVRLELWSGARGDQERRVLRAMEETLVSLQIDGAVWDVACDLASRTRAKGLTVPASDILVAACARHHRVTIEHADAHFDMIASVW